MRPPKQPFPADSASARTRPQPPQQVSPVLISLSQHIRPDPWPQTRRQTDESPRSPLRSHSPHRSDEMEKTSSPSSKGGGALVVSEKYYSPLQSPLPVTPPYDAETPEHSVQTNSHMINFSRTAREEPFPSALVLGSGGGGGGVNGGRRRIKKATVEHPIVNRSNKEILLLKAALALRICEVILSLLSFSVMATDKTEGWSGDSFDRYKEYRFCLAINVIAFVYAAFQACELTYNLTTGRHILTYSVRYQFAFLMDQVLAYLLMSASSASASRIDDWVSNWGKDAFTAKASASVTLSFLAFAGFAVSSLISGYNYCNRDII